MYKIAICDDDEIYRKQVEDAINTSPYYSLCELYCYDKCNDLLKSNEQFNIAFLDIELLDGSGIELGNNLRKKHPKIIIFFITSYTQYISDAFATMPFQYIIKPLKNEIFQREFERAIAFLKKTNEIITFKTQGDYIKINIDQLLYVTRYNRKVSIILIDKNEYFINENFDVLEKTLLKYDFYRCHNSYIINIKYLEKIMIRKNMLILYKKYEIPVSRKYIDNIKHEFLKEVGVII